MLSVRWRSLGILALFAAALVAPVSLAKAPPASDTTIPVGPRKTITNPAASPVRLARVGDQLDAHFSGEFVLSGQFRFGCRFDCDRPLKNKDLALTIRPDAALAKRLPVWADRPAFGIDIVISDAGPFAERVIGRARLRQLRSGKIDHVSGRTAIRVDQLVVAIECDTPSYSARFRRFAMPRSTFAQRDDEVAC